MIINQIKQMLIFYINNFKIRNVTINIDNNFSVNYILENVQIITLIDGGNLSLSNLFFN